MQQASPSVYNLARFKVVSFLPKEKRTRKKEKKNKEKNKKKKKKKKNRRKPYQ